MLSKLKGYLNQTHLGAYFLPKKDGFVSSKLCGIMIDFPHHSFTVGLMQPIQGLKQIDFCKTYPLEKIEELKVQLMTIVNEYHIKNADCLWILQQDEYQLILTDSLPVTPAEFQEAIRWKIKDVIRFPLDDVVLDSFPMPNKKPGDAHEMIMVVAASASYLQKQSDLIRASGLNLKIIDIPELAIRNIMALYDDDEKSTALICEQGNRSQLLITSNKKLYFIRQIEVNLTSLKELKEGQPLSDQNVLLLNQFALEIQRSFDYYQSQWRQPIPPRIFYVAPDAVPFDMANELSQRLSQPIKMFNVADKITIPNTILLTELNQHMPLIGGLLRDH